MKKIHFILISILFCSTLSNSKETLADLKKYGLLPKDIAEKD